MVAIPYTVDWFNEFDPVRTIHGRCADEFYKCTMIPSLQCNCSAKEQKVTHIIQECPLRASVGYVKDIPYIALKAVHLPKLCVFFPDFEELCFEL